MALYIGSTKMSLFRSEIESFHATKCFVSYCAKDFVNCRSTVDRSHDEPQPPVSCHNGVLRIRCVLVGAAYCGANFIDAFAHWIYLALRSALTESLRRVFTLRTPGASPGQWVNTSVRFILEVYLTLRSALRKVTACFYPQNIRRAARKFLSAQGASPEQLVNTTVRFMLEIYLTLRSAMRKVTACFYPQNIRRAARKFLSAQGASPEQSVNTSVRFILGNLCRSSIA